MEAAGTVPAMRNKERIARTWTHTDLCVFHVEKSTGGSDRPSTISRHTCIGAEIEWLALSAGM